MRFLIRLPARVLTAVALLAFAAVLLFFGLTRTQVGRDGLRGQIERTFAQQFRGSIEIGQLTGNLVYDLYATDVRLLDPEGRVVLAADSVVVAPTWWGLVRRKLVIDDATIFGPRIDLVRSDSGRWNLADVFAARRPRTGPSNPLDLSAPSIRLVDATLTTQREGDAPAIVQRGTLFDYTTATVTDLDLRADLRWSREQRLIRVREMTASAVDPEIQIRRLEGVLDFSDGDVRLRDIELGTEESWIAGDFSLDRSDTAPSVFALTLEPSQINGDELRRIVPASPLADAVLIGAEARGPLSDLTVDFLTLERGATDLRLEGSLTGLPDSAAFAVAIPRSTLHPRDVEAVLPTLRLPDLRGLGTVVVKGDASGAVGGGRGFRVASALDVRTDAGRADGTFRLRQRPGRALAYVIDADVRDLDPGRVLADPALAGDLTGHVALDGRGTNAETLDTQLRLALTESRFAGRDFESLDADVTADGLRLSGNAALTAGGGLRASGTADLASGPPAFDLALAADRFDLRRLLDGAPPTQLTADVALVGTGRTLDDFSGDLTVDFGPSTLTLAEEPRPIPAHTTALRLRPAGSAEPRIDLDSDLLALRVRGDLDAGAFVALTAQWTDAVARTVQAEQAKYYHPPADSLRRLPPPASPAVAAAPQDVAFDVEIRRPAALQALLPGFPALAPGTALDARARFAPDSLVLDLTARGDSLRVPGFFSGPFAGTLALRSGYGQILLGRTALDFALRADTLRIPIGPLADATAALRLRGRQADLTVRSAQIGDAGRFDLEAGLDLRPDLTRLSLREVVAEVGGQTWTASGPQTLDLYADAIVLRALAFERAQAVETPPRLALRGVLSPLASDSLFVDATALDLDEVFSVLGLRKLFGGELDARFAVAGVFGQPAVVGAATVEEFAFAGRRAGRIGLTSSVLPAEAASPSTFTSCPTAIRSPSSTTSAPRGPSAFPAPTPMARATPARSTSPSTSTGSTCSSSTGSSPRSSPTHAASRQAPGKSRASRASPSSTPTSASATGGSACPTSASRSKQRAASPSTARASTSATPNSPTSRAGRVSCAATSSSTTIASSPSISPPTSPSWKSSTCRTRATSRSTATSAPPAARRSPARSTTCFSARPTRRRRLTARCSSRSRRAVPPAMPASSSSPTRSAICPNLRNGGA